MFINFIFIILVIAGLISVLPHSFWMIFHEGPPSE